MRRITKAGVALSLVVGVSVSMGSPAQADKKRRDQAANSAQDGKVAAKVSHIRIVQGDSKGGGKTVKLDPKDPDWEAPACWYEPKTTPKQLKKKIEDAKPEKRDEDEKDEKDSGTIFGDLEKSNQKAADALSEQVVHLYENYYQTDKYDDYNMDQQGKGYFWEGVRNPDRADDPEADACSEHAIWVPKGDPPEDMPLAVSPKILAEYAYEQLPIPETELSLNPDGKQTVNLDTWVWLDRSRFKPVKAIAELDLIDGTRLSATTTATPESLTLEPGTGDAKTYPASGKCEFENGALGEKYSAGKKNRTPPCGIRYLRATGENGSYTLKATLTWKVEWKSTEDPGGTFPSGTFSTTKNLTVKEIQSIVRD
ncbi:hypothetical protein AN217_10615 [Streptomyces qinglanensis]|uniref:Enoyl reductase n=2 Tax=Streptomyces qinglanensis TaxID=943816 RepID=A0A1E7K2P6_9ACTN|nr:hypothetical protein AN217_10615 [Streptomyces qinglanensis]OEV26016.1 hypothetical protein AN220_10440 [Streptomyces nanshensis]